MGKHSSAVRLAPTLPTRLDRQNLRDHHFSALRGHWAVHLPRLPARIQLLGVWIQKVSEQPAAVWWASGQVGLHSDVQAQIRFGLERAKKTGSPEIRKAWWYIFEAWETLRHDFHRGWFILKASIDRDGWTSAAVRRVRVDLSALSHGRETSWRGAKTSRKQGRCFPQRYGAAKR